MRRGISRRQILLSGGFYALWPHAQNRGLTERLGASTACLPGYSLLQALQILGRLGFSTVELITYEGASHSAGPIPGFTFHRMATAEREALYAATRPFRHISGHLPFQDLHLFSRNRDIREFSRQLVERTVDGLSFLRAELAVLHIGSPPAGAAYRAIWGDLLGFLARIGDYAAERKIKIGIETMQPDTVRDFTELIQDLNHAHVGAVIDTGHIRSCRDLVILPEERNTPRARRQYNEVLFRLVETLGSRVFHYHLNDVRGEDWVDHRTLGTGIVDFQRLFQHLARSAWKGLMVLELEEPDSVAALEQSKSFIEKL